MKRNIIAQFIQNKNSIQKITFIVFAHCSDVDFLDTWKAMETLVDSGLVKSIGVANFNSKQINRLLANCRIKPVANQVINYVFNFFFVKNCKIQNFKLQIEVSLQFIQKELIKFCHEHDIIVTAVCPMGRPNPAEKKPEILYDAKLMEIGEKYGKTPAQIVFRYLVRMTLKLRLTRHFSLFYF